MKKFAKELNLLNFNEIHVENSNSRRKVIGMRRLPFILPLLLASWVGSVAQAQLVVERTVTANLTVSDNGTSYSQFWWTNAGLSSISDTKVTVNFSQLDANNPIVLGQYSSALRFQMGTINGITNSVFGTNGLTSLSQTFDLGAVFSNAILGGTNSWALFLTDTQGGGVGRLDSWKLTLEGAAATNGTFRPGANGRLAVSSGQTNAAVGAAVDVETAGSSVAAEAGEGRTLRLEGGLTGAGNLDTTTVAGGKVVIGGNSTNFSGIVKVKGSGTTELTDVRALGTGRLQQTNGSSTVRLNFTGTMSNDLSVFKVAFATNGATLAGTTTVNNAEFDVAGGDTNTITGQITGSGGVTKTGLGTLVLAGTTTNDFTGASAVNAGTLFLNKTAGTTAISGSTIAVNSGGTLLLGAANQISDSTQVTMAGGTVALGGYNETAGRLAVTADSIFDFGTAAGGTNTFTFADFDTSGYGGVAGLTFSNVGAGSKVVFNSDYTGNTTFNTFTSKISFTDAALEGQISFSGGTTTLTVAAIPDARVVWAAGVLCALVGAAEWRRCREKKIGVSS